MEGRITLLEGIARGERANTGRLLRNPAGYSSGRGNDGLHRRCDERRAIIAEVESGPESLTLGTRFYFQDLIEERVGGHIANSNALSLLSLSRLDLRELELIICENVANFFIAMEF